MRMTSPIRHIMTAKYCLIWNLVFRNKRDMIITQGMVKQSKSITLKSKQISNFAIPCDIGVLVSFDDFQH